MGHLVGPSGDGDARVWPANRAQSTTARATTMDRAPPAWRSHEALARRSPPVCSPPHRAGLGDTRADGLLASHGDRRDGQRPRAGPRHAVVELYAQLPGARLRGVRPAVRAAAD